MLRTVRQVRQSMRERFITPGVPARKLVGRKVRH